MVQSSYKIIYKWYKAIAFLRVHARSLFLHLCVCKKQLFDKKCPWQDLNRGHLMLGATNCATAITQ